MTIPLVSCICPTFGRAPDFANLLWDAVYWFNAQVYPNKELIIWNDCEVQTLRCDVPGVRVINSAAKFKTLGDKYNAMVEAAKGEIILPWEDDDVSLPGRIRQAVFRLGSADYFNPQQTWYEENGILHHKHKHGVCHNASAYRKSLWKSVAGYPSTTGDQDALIDAKMKMGGNIGTRLWNFREWTYIYRWGVSPNHISGNKDMQGVYDKASARPGVVYIPLVLNRDYVSDIEKILSPSKSQV